MTGDYAGQDLGFVGGCPRSGTTWVQRLLAACPGVRTGQESDLFDEYVGPALRHWRRDLASPGRPVGMGCHHTEERFLAVLRGFMLGLLAPMRAGLGPGELFVEKTPSHALDLPEIAELLPRCRVGPIVLRDCRDAVASLLAASRGWGAGWAPPTARGAAAMWTRHVRAAAQGRELFGPRFSLRCATRLCWRRPRRVARPGRGFPGPAPGRPPGWPGRGGLPAEAGAGGPPSLGGQWARAGAAPGEPEGFVRRARGRGWRQELGRLDMLRVWRAARRRHGPGGLPLALALAGPGPAPGRGAAMSAQGTPAPRMAAVIPTFGGLPACCGP
jgi:hypothetical protein